MTKSRDTADSINRIDSSAADATAITIDANENVGIGTSSPSGKLHVKDQTDIAMSNNADGQLILEGNGYSGAIALNATGMQIYQNSAARNIIFGNDETEQMRVTSTGDLLVGKTTTDIGTAGSRLITNGQIQATASNNEPYFANRLSSDGVLFDFRKDGSTVGTIGNSSTTLYVSSSQAGGLRFTYSGSNPIIAPCNTAGANLDNSADLGFASARFKDLYLGGGVYVGGTGSANHLDDYEEGTFTPTYIGSVSNPTITYDRQNGHYVKIGRQVIVNIEIRNEAIEGGSGNFYVGGLPFTPVAPAGTTRAGTAHIGYSSAFNDKGPQTAYINGGFNAIVLLRSSDTDSWGENDTGMATSDFLGGSNDNFLMITAIYAA